MQGSAGVRKALSLLMGTCILEFSVCKNASKRHLSWRPISALLLLSLYSLSFDKWLRTKRIVRDQD
jgi:hypothetical protein